MLTSFTKPNRTVACTCSRNDIIWRASTWLCSTFLPVYCLGRTEALVHCRHLPCPCPDFVQWNQTCYSFRSPLLTAPTLHPLSPRLRCSCRSLSQSVTQWPGTAAPASASAALQSRDAPPPPSVRAWHILAAVVGFRQSAFKQITQETGRQIRGEESELTHFCLSRAEKSRWVNGRGTAWSSCAAAQASVRSREPEEGQQIHEMGWCK